MQGPGASSLRQHGRCSLRSTAFTLCTRPSALASELRVQYQNTSASVVPNAASPRLPGLAQYQSSVRCRVASLTPTPLPDTAPQPQPTQADWYNNWYPVLFEPDLDKKQLHRVEILGKHLVVWWDPNASAWRIFDDLCPHRLVPLSEGRVNTKGHLECGYHGWEWNGAGACQRIPTGGNPTNPRACVRSYPAVVKQDILWTKPVALPAPGPDTDPLAVATSYLADTDRIPIVPELEDQGWVSQDAWRDLPYDYTTLLENVMDVSHVPWTHHKSISNRNMTGDFELKLDAPPSVNGLSGHWPTGPRAGKLGPQSTTFVAPCYMKHKLDAAKTRGFEALTVVYAVPQAPGRCRLINRNCTRFVKSGLPGLLIGAIPTWVQHVMSHIPLEDDQIFLHLGEPEYLRRRLAGSTPQGAYFLASPADTLVAAFRVWLDRFGGGGPFGPVSEAFIAATGPRQSRTALLDRYSQHTAHCATCQKGLKQVTTGVAALTCVAVAATLAAVFSAAVAVAHAWTGGAAGAATAAVAGAGGNVVMRTLATAALTLGEVVVGGGSPSDQMLRALTWAVLAGLATYWRAGAEQLRGTFFSGSYPPMRNTATDP